MYGLSVNAFQPQSVTVMQNGAAPAPKADAADKGGFGFGDLVDTLNPLHHIPIVGQIYRAVTGDQISDTARMAGGGLFAGPLGVGIAAATISMRDAKGADATLVQMPEETAPAASLAAPQHITPAKETPAQAALTQTMGDYDTIAKGYWTQSNLQALAKSFGLNAPEGASNEAASQNENPPSLDAYKVPDVSQPETLAPPDALAGANSAVYTQMLANLEKFDASTAAPR